MSDASLATILDSAKRVITDPAGFYRSMPQDGGFAAPVIFVLVMAVVSGIIVALLAMLGGGMGAAGVPVGFMAVVMLPIMALIGSFIGAAIMFVIWKLMGSDRSFETAYRCVAYAAAIMPITTLLALIPYLGSIVKVLWSFFLMYVASIEAHGIKARTAAIVFGVLGALMLLLNLSAERAAMQMAEQMGELGSQMEGLGGSLEGIEEMSPEEAGKAVGEFMKGLEGAIGQQR